MIVPDVNLLIYAYDSTCPLHARCRDWWEKTIAGGDAIGIPWVVVLAFARLMTHPTLNENPMTIPQLRERVEEWLNLPQVLLLVPREATLRHMFALLEGCGAGGNLSTDALIGAHALEHGGIVHSNDHDFARFEGVRWINPLGSAL